MADDVESIDVRDPLLIWFTLQHDLRERFLHALEEIVRVRYEGDGDSDALLKQMSLLAEDAIDTAKIEEWMNANRPLPWLTDPGGQQITDAVVRVLESQGEYLPSNDPIE